MGGRVDVNKLFSHAVSRLHAPVTTHIATTTAATATVTTTTTTTMTTSATDCSVRRIFLWADQPIRKYILTGDLFGAGALEIPRLALKDSFRLPKWQLQQSFCSGCLLCLPVL